MTTWTTFRDGIDSWVIAGTTEGGLYFELPFATQEARDEAWQVLQDENLKDERFLYGRPGLLGYDQDNVAKASAYARTLEAQVLEAERS